MKQILQAAILVCFLAFAAVTNAQPPEGEFTYKGVPLGVGRAEFAERLPDWQCSGIAACEYTWNACYKKAQKENRPWDDCAARNSFGGASPSFGTARFRNDKLGSLYFSISSTHATELMKAAAVRYGIPKDTDETPFRTKSGGTFPNVKMTWERAGSTMTVWLNSGKLGDGAVLVMSEEERRLAAEEGRSKVQKGATDF